MDSRYSLEILDWSAEPLGMVNLFGENRYIFLGANIVRVDAKWLSVSRWTSDQKGEVRLGAASTRSFSLRIVESARRIRNGVIVAASREVASHEERGHRPEEEKNYVGTAFILKSWPNFSLLRLFPRSSTHVSLSLAVWICFIEPFPIADEIYNAWRKMTACSLVKLGSYRIPSSTFFLDKKTHSRLSSSVLVTKWTHAQSSFYDTERVLKLFMNYFLKAAIDN